MLPSVDTITLGSRLAQMMTPMAMFGMVLAVLAVLSAYGVGHATGFAVGQRQGFDEGKREGAREGSQRGYAVGFDRGRRGASAADEDPPARRGLRWGALALLAAAATLFFLASQSRKQAVSGPTEDVLRPTLTTVVPPMRFVVEPTHSTGNSDERPLLPVPAQANDPGW